MNRVDIVALTLAEISLALLFAFIAIFLPAYAHVRKEVASVGDIQKQLIDINATNAQLRRDVENWVSDGLENHRA